MRRFENGVLPNRRQKIRKTGRIAGAIAALSLGAACAAPERSDTDPAKMGAKITAEAALLQAKIVEISNYNDHSVTISRDVDSSSGKTSFTLTKTLYTSGRPSRIYIASLAVEPNGARSAIDQTHLSALSLASYILPEGDTNPTLDKQNYSFTLYFFQDSNWQLISTEGVSSDYITTNPEDVRGIVRMATDDSITSAFNAARQSLLHMEA